MVVAPRFVILQPVSKTRNRHADEAFIQTNALIKHEDIAARSELFAFLS
jgi:hypothetical protein